MIGKTNAIATADIKQVVVPSAESKDVNFYDSNGSILYSYTKAEFLALTEMPPLVTSIVGAIPQRWNWDLDTAQYYVNSTVMGILDIGLNSAFDKTILQITITQDEQTLSIPLFYTTYDTYCFVNWGDGSSEELCYGYTWRHLYSKAGDYTITFEKPRFIDSNGLSDIDTSLNVAYISTNGKSEEPGNVILNYIGVSDNFGYRGVLHPSMQMRILNFPVSKPFYDKKSTSTGEWIPTIAYYGSFRYFANNCIICPYSKVELSQKIEIRNILQPLSVVCFSSFGFTNMDYIYLDSSRIKRMTLPDNIINIQSLRLIENAQLEYVVFPSKINRIVSIDLTNCSSLRMLDLSRCVSVPSLISGITTTGVPASMKIIVPDSLYSSWCSATNWSALASYIVRLSDYNE